MSSAPLVKLSNGKSIPQLGFGVYLVSTDVATNITYEALKQGYRHIDSAEAYKNEAEVVKGIKKWLDEDPQNNKREDVWYTTKIKTDRVTYEETAKSIKERVAIAKEHIGYIDLVLIHSPKTNKEGRLGAWKALQEYVEEHPDDVKSLGISNYGVKHLRELFSWDGLKIKPVINQIELNPWLTHPDIVTFGKQAGVATEAYSPLTRGIRINDPEIESYAKKYGKSNGQILIKWSLQKGFIPLVKTVNVDRVKENFDVFDWELSLEDVKALSHDDEYWVSHPQWDPTTYEDPEN